MCSIQALDARKTERGRARLVQTGPMIKLELLVGVVSFALWVFCLVDVIGAPEHRIRHLPKIAWLLLVLLFPLVGSIAWLAVGRPDGSVARRSAHEREQPDFPQYDRPGRAAAVDPQKDEEFLRRVHERAEEQRRRYEQSRRPRPETEQPQSEQPDEPTQPDEK
jgi:hypothetical protein